MAGGDEEEGEGGEGGEALGGWVGWLAGWMFRGDGWLGE